MVAQVRRQSYCADSGTESLFSEDVWHVGSVVVAATVSVPVTLTLRR